MIVDAKVRGNIEANDLDTHSNSIIDGNIRCKKVSIGGKLKGNIKSDKINIKKQLKLKVLSIRKLYRLRKVRFSKSKRKRISSN